MNNKPLMIPQASGLCKIWVGFTTAVIFAMAAHAATGSSPPSDMPGDYYDDGDAAVPSSSCQKTFKKGIMLPRNNFLPNRYVLLLVFDNLTNSEGAGQTLFHTDPPAATPPSSAEMTLSRYGCITDPDTQNIAISPAQDLAHAGWGLRVKGGCPSDCVGYTILNARAADPCPPSVSPDPLSAVPTSKDPKGLHWGIFFAISNDSGCIDGHDQARVWQIRVKDALHAQRVLKAVVDQISTNHLPGYLGHLLIGYTSNQCKKTDTWNHDGSNSRDDERIWNCEAKTPTSKAGD